MLRASAWEWQAPVRASLGLVRSVMHTSPCLLASRERLGPEIAPRRRPGLRGLLARDVLMHPVPIGDHVIKRRTLIWPGLAALKSARVGGTPWRGAPPRLCGNTAKTPRVVPRARASTPRASARCADLAAVSLAPSVARDPGPATNTMSCSPTRGAPSRSSRAPKTVE
jgi:hypothetical protein